MYEINKNDQIVRRNREHIKEQVERFFSIGKTEKEIINWIENYLDPKIGLYNYFDSVYELAEFVNIPVSKFTISWM